MRVLIAVPRLAMPGGVSNYYTALRHYLDAQKVYFEVGGVPGETGRWRKLRRLLIDYWRFHRRLSTERFDLVHLNPSMDLPSVFRDGVLVLIARLHRRSLLVFYRGWIPSAEAHVRRYHQRLFRWVYGQADANLVLAESFRRTLAVMGVRLPTFIETTVVDDAVLAAAAGATRINALPRSPGKLCRILYLARLDVGKGLPEAIDAFARLQQLWPAVSLTVAGDGRERAAAELDVRRRGLVNVSFLGHVTGDAKARAFTEADIYLFTSRAEGMPNSVLEAMASGLPIVTRLVGGICDFFEDGRMGYATEGSSASDYTELLARLVRNPGLCKSIGRYNQEFARRHFAAPVVAARLLAIYVQVGVSLRRPKRLVPRSYLESVAVGPVRRRWR
jgi:glycosyltransferase involved in cell wall biosynthesis